MAENEWQLDAILGVPSAEAADAAQQATGLRSARVIAAAAVALLQGFVLLSQMGVPLCQAGIEFHDLLQMPAQAMQMKRYPL